MLSVRAACRRGWPRRNQKYILQQNLSTYSYLGEQAKSPWSAIRNVSFWGHIDAGKTTLTERVLYMAKALIPPIAIDRPSIKSGAGQLPGDVDSGSTVTDFLDAERQRGITIQSAAVGPFEWQPKEALGNIPKSRITLIDTPGHIDFTIEVERSLRVADGCVILIDGVEGIESQTESVWQIAKRYNVQSHVVFVNKLDRMGASLSNSVKSILVSGIHKRPTILQLPIFHHDSSLAQESSLIGTIDLTSRPIQAYFYGGKAGEIIDIVSLKEAVQQGRVSLALSEEARRGRDALVECLGSLDESLLDRILTLSSKVEEGHNANDFISTEELRKAIRRQTIAGEVLPILCGSAQKAIGVQAVLDAINWYLPAPNEAGDKKANRIREVIGGCVIGNIQDDASNSSQVALSLSDPDLSLLAFKVVYDKQKGPMTFVRIYSGSLTRSITLFNTTSQAKERLSKILFAYGDRYVEAESLEAGQVGVIIGLRNTRTGDTLVDNRAATMSLKGKVPRKSSEDAVIPWASDASRLRLRRVHVPPPVFSVSLEPMGKSDEAQVREALDMLIRTDPSLRIDYGDNESIDGSGLGSAGVGQIVLSGMGELHLEIAKDRLLNDFKAKAVMGTVRVSYREALADEKEGEEEATFYTEEIDREVMGKKLRAKCEISVRNLKPEEIADDTLGGNVISIDLGNATEIQDDFETAQIRSAIRFGIAASLARGPLSWNAIMGMHISIKNIETFGPQVSTPKAWTLLASQALTKVIKNMKLTIMEPVMKVKIDCDEQYLGKVSSVLSSEQNGIVERVDHQIGKIDSNVDISNIYLPLEEESIATTMSGEERRGNIACTIYATVPLVKLVNYSSKLRALTKGSGIFEMSLQGFTVASSEREKEILSELGRL